MGPASHQTKKYGKRLNGHIPKVSQIGKGVKNDGCVPKETRAYTGLVLGGKVLFWTFGPKIVLLFLHEAMAVGHR